jgi:hypothetical protein
MGTARNGQLEMLKWAVENGAPFNLQRCAELATQHHAASKWLRALLANPDRQREMNLTTQIK